MSKHTRPSLTTKSHVFGGAVLTPKHARELTPWRVLSVTAAVAEASIVHNNNGPSPSHSNTGGNSISGGSYLNSNHYPSNHMMGGSGGAGPSSSGSWSGGDTYPSRGHNMNTSSFDKRDRKNMSHLNNSNHSNNSKQAFRRMSSESMSMDEFQYRGGGGGGGTGSGEPPTVQYTVWITEAWNVLNWAQPNAALFWEMATMFHTLHVADRARWRNYSGQEDASVHVNTGLGSGVGSPDYIPPILSCGSTSSVGTSITNPGTTSPNAGMSSFNNNNNSNNTNNPNTSSTSNANIKRKNTGVVAKELPVWLLGTFLLLHCEGQAFARNVSGEDERRFDAVSRKGTGGTSGEILQPLHSSSGNTVDFPTLLKHPSLSPRTRIHAGHNTDSAHCAFVLAHLRKFLLFIALPHNTEALYAIQKLIAMGDNGNSSHTSRSHSSSQHHSQSHSQSSHHHHNANSHQNNQNLSYNPSHSPYHPDPQQISNVHNREHGSIGYNVYLTPEDLERLSFILHPPNGGLIDDPPLQMSDLFYVASKEEEEEEKNMRNRSTYNHHHLQKQQNIDGEWNALSNVERKLRRYMEEELSSLVHDSQTDEDDTDVDVDDGDVEVDAQEEVEQALSKMSIRDDGKPSMEEQKQSHSRSGLKQTVGYQKELSYKNLSQKSILLKPRSHPDNEHSNSSYSPTATSVNTNTRASSPQPLPPQPYPTPNRLHDLTISDCNDVHMYLLQPFENITISACTGCHIVIGAVAGLLHVVDCERTTITSASRRALVSNSFEVLNCIFTPSPPLLVGDNRSCQFAPYNTYYDGLIDDLLATGLAAQVVDSQQQLQSLQLPQHVQVQCSSNKWKMPLEMAKFNSPSIDPPVSNPTDKSPNSPKQQHSGDDAMPTPILQPPSEFQIIFVPLESVGTNQRRQLPQQQQQSNTHDESSIPESTSSNSENVPTKNPTTGNGTGTESQYCRNLTDLLQLSPFHLPYEYEKRVIVKADRMRSLQQAIQTDLTLEQKTLVENELNQGFREWLVTSGNLRQVLDLVHMEKNGVL